MTQLIAFDEEDLGVVSAVLNGARLRMRDFSFNRQNGLFVGVGVRKKIRSAQHDDVGFGLHVRGVLGVRHIGFERRLDSQSRNLIVHFVGFHFEHRLALHQNLARAQDTQQQLIHPLEANIIDDHPDGLQPQGYLRLFFDEGRQILLDVDFLEVHMRDMNFQHSEGDTV